MLSILYRAEGVIGDSKYGATIVDSLDTLYLMGLHKEFNEGVEWVAENLDFSTST
jgi:mannosyl-oligosaccharide alpha-1,2-mannosidase